MKYKVGDRVRIKTPQELKGYKVHYGTAIDKWQNEICVVCAETTIPSGQRYKLSFLYPREKPEDMFACGINMCDYLWEEFELAAVPIEEETVDQVAYEQLIGGDTK